MKTSFRLGTLSRRGATIALAAVLTGGTVIGSAVAYAEAPADAGYQVTAAPAHADVDQGADRDDRGGDPGVTHPELDTAGSTIRAHEGGDVTAEVAPFITHVKGLDVSAYQSGINWSTVLHNGGKFAYVKATEGTGYQSAAFNSQYEGAYRAGLIRGAYHFALPNKSSGRAQADYFVRHGGGWSKDGKTLPPMLDIEYDPYGATCYGLSQGAMRSWIKSFSDEVHARTSRFPTIYTTTNWWSQCTGNWGGLGKTNPLFIARYSSTPGALPAGWGFWTIWQYNDHGIFPGDQDAFNGGLDRVKALANG